MTDVRKPVANPELVAAMDRMRANSSKENQDQFIIELKKANFLAPISMSEKETVPGTGVAFEMLESGDGKVCIPVFSDWEQLDKWKSFPDQQTMLVNVNDLNYLVTSNPKVSGFVINPFGHCVMFTEDMLSILLKLAKSSSSSGGQAGAASGDRMASVDKDLDEIFGPESRRTSRNVYENDTEIPEDDTYRRRNTYQSLEEKYRQERLKARGDKPDSERGTAMETAADLHPELEGTKNKSRTRGLQATAYEVYDDSEVQIGDPKFYPHELVDCVSFYLKKQRQVKAVYLKLMEREGEKSFLFIVDFSGDRQSVFSGIAEAAAPYLKGMYLDMVPFESEFGKKAVEESKPFYTRKLFGLF